MLSIIIPTLNEELYLPPLLRSLKHQEGEFEVIIVDGNSKDKTREVVESFKKEFGQSLKLIHLEQPNLSKQRNTGVKNAAYDTLLFLDADVVLPKDFISKSLKQLKQRKIKFAGTKIYAAEPGTFYRIMYWSYSNFYLPVLRMFNPVVHGCSIFITKELHYKVGEFPMDVTFEDFMYARKVAEYSRPKLLKGIYVRTSARRYYNPTFREVSELLLSGVYSMFKAGMKGKSFMHKFHDNYGKHSEPKYDYKEKEIKK